MQGNIRFIAVMLMLGATQFEMNWQFHALKNDPVCEQARAALDTINARNEENKNHARLSSH